MHYLFLIVKPARLNRVTCEGLLVRCELNFHNLQSKNSHKALSMASCRPHFHHPSINPEAAGFRVARVTIASGSGGGPPCARSFRLSSQC